GTKEGCGEGECGACTVLVDGEVACACLVPFAQVRGASVKTIESVKPSDPLARAFVVEGGAQCGICTPGMILAASKLRRGATRAEMRAALAGNLCRCTGYEAIYRAIETARRSPRRKPSARRASRTKRRGRGGER